MTISQYVRGATFVSMALDGNKHALKTIGRAWLAVMREMVGKIRGEAGEAFEEKIRTA